MRTPRDARGRFVNWAGTVVSAPSEWRTPASEDEVAEIVRSAARGRRRVRVVGAGHSWSRVAAPEDVAVSLDRLAGVLEVDRARGVATVRGGTRLRSLVDDLARVGMTLPILGSITQQAVAGAIATGTHGSSLVHGNLASLVEGIRLVTASGDALDLDAGDARLDGARVHLGALGVVTRVTLRVEPAFRLAATVDAVPIGAVAAALPSIARSAEYVKVWWVPHTKAAYVHRYVRTTEAASAWPSAKAERWIDERLFHAVLFPGIMRMQRRFARTIPAVNRAVARTIARPRRVGASDLMLGTPMPVVHRETEAAVPMDRSGEALDRVVASFERERLAINFPIEVRFVRGDGGWMSPAYGGDTCQIGAYSGDVADCDAYFAAFWREMRALGARPHWGKEMDHGAEEVSRVFPAAARFARLRDDVDPGRVFGSTFLERVLG